MNGAASGEAVGPAGAIGPAGPLLLPPPSGDQALSARAEDTLGRAPLAEAVAAHIASVSPEESVVFGLVGPWGSGKTSLLGMIEDSLRNDHGALVAYFNPWLFSGAEGLVDFFFAELGAGLGDLSGKPVQDLGASMQDYGELLGSVRTEPTVGRGAAAAGGPVRIFGGRLKGAADERASLLERKNRVAGALERLGRNLVVMVDDLDRLRREEIRDVVALVRLNADLPHLVFVLAYDRARVEQALAEEEGDGRSYLEKIVQVVHDVPEARTVDVKSALVDAFAEVTDAAAEMGPYDPDRVGEVLNEIVFPLVGTLRGVKRYANALPVTLRAVGDEVALADVLALEAIRLFMPETYSKLSASAEALTTATDAYIVSSYKDRDKKVVEELLKSDGGRRHPIEKTCELLFPAGLALVENNHYDTREDDKAGSQRRVANWRFLRFFLDKRLSQEVVPARKVQDVFEAFGHPDRLRALLEDEDLDGLDRLMLRLQEYEDAFQPREVLQAIPIISDRHARLMSEAGRAVDFGADVSYGGLMRRMLDKVEDPEQLTYQLKTILPRIESLSARLELVSIVGHRPNTGEKRVSQEDADWFEGYMVTALENASKENLAKEYALTRLLIRARQQDEERGDRLIARLAEDDGIFLAALLRYYNRSNTGVEDGPMQERLPTLRWDDLCSLFGEDTTRRRVDELRRKFEPPDLGEHPAEALQLANLYATGRPPTWEQRT